MLLKSCTRVQTVLCVSDETASRSSLGTHETHAEALQIYRNNTHTHTLSHTLICTRHRGCEGLLWIMAVYTSIHPGLFCCQTSLECADYKAECLWFCHVTSCVLCSLVVEWKKGLIMSKIVPLPPPLLWNIQVMIGNFKGFRFNQLHRASFSLFLFSFSFFFISINCQLIDVNSHTSGFLSPPQPVAALICYDLHFYPAASRLANVENCKLNPESPNLRLVSCFSNVHIKGAKKKNAKQGLSNGKK